MRGVILQAMVLIAVAAGAVSAGETPKVVGRVVMMIGEEEYKTWETLPAFAKEELEPAGFRVRVVHADEKDKNNFPGLVEALRDADVLVVSVRRRAMPVEQMDAIKAHLAAGKGLVGIRTACHALRRGGRRSGNWRRGWWIGRGLIRRCWEGITMTTGRPVR